MYFQKKKINGKFNQNTLEAIRVDPPVHFHKIGRISAVQGKKKKNIEVFDFRGPSRDRYSLLGNLCVLATPSSERRENLQNYTAFQRCFTIHREQQETGCCLDVCQITNGIHIKHTKLK